MRYLIILLFIPFTIFAQKKNVQPKLIIKVSPLAFVDFVSFPSTLVGAEYFINKQYSIEANAGLVFGYEYWSLQKGTGYKTKFEVKRYSKKHPKFYWALEAIHNKVNYTSISEFIDTLHTNSYKDTFRINKTVSGLNVKCGFLLQIRKKTTIDFFFGAGYRNKISNQIGKDNNIGDYWYRHPNVKNTRDYLGVDKEPSLLFGIKIGYLILNK